jgi:hypothetical protein
VFQYAVLRDRAADQRIWRRHVVWETTLFYFAADALRIL